MAKHYYPISFQSPTLLQRDSVVSKLLVQATQQTSREPGSKPLRLTFCFLAAGMLSLTSYKSLRHVVYSCQCLSLVLLLQIFGVANITKLLSELPLHQREDAVNSLAYEADARVKDPVYGCVGAISVLQQQVAQLSADLAIANAELARYQQRGPGQAGLQQQAGPSDQLAFAALAGTMASLGGMQGQGGSVGPLQRPPHGRQS